MIEKGQHNQKEADQAVHHLQKERTVEFGEGENDVGLLEWAGFAVAVANAHERLLALADWVCPPAAEEGPAQAIEALLDSRP